MNTTICKIDKVEWFNWKTSNMEIMYEVVYDSVDGWPVVSHFDTEIEAEEYLIQRIKVKQSFKVK